jgi:transcriptional regulator with XRE-family HTH domain
MIDEAELGRRLRAAREQLDLTQEQVAVELGLSRGALAQLELGMRAPNSLQLARLAEIYQHELGDFLAEDFDAATLRSLTTRPGPPPSAAAPTSPASTPTSRRSSGLRASAPRRRSTTCPHRVPAGTQSSRVNDSQTRSATGSGWASTRSATSEPSSSSRASARSTRSFCRKTSPESS